MLFIGTQVHMLYAGTHSIYRDTCYIQGHILYIGTHTMYRDTYYVSGHILCIGTHTMYRDTYYMYQDMFTQNMYTHKRS